MRQKPVKKTFYSHSILAAKRPIMRKVAMAAIVTLVTYFTFVYLNTGRIFFVREMLTEIGLAFIFLLVLFWSHGIISRYMQSPRIRQLPVLLRAPFETVVVIITTILINLLTNFIPLYLIFGAFPPGRARTSFVVTTIISLFFYYFVERERSRKRLQEEHLRAERLQKENFRAQLESLKNQVNPHFLFNSLNVLHSLIYVNQDQAAEFATQLSDVYRAILDKGDKTLVSLSEELELVESYTALLKTRFGEDLNIVIDVAPEMLAYSLPPGALQMLVENAVKHNGFAANKPLNIEIATTANQIRVRNNCRPRLEEVESTGIGLRNIRLRYRYLTEEEMQVKSKEESFEVRLPLIKETL